MFNNGIEFMKVRAGSYIVVRNTDSVSCCCYCLLWPKLPKLNARLTVACARERKYFTPVNCGRDKPFVFYHLISISFYLVDILLNIVSNINDMT